MRFRYYKTSDTYTSKVRKEQLNVQTLEDFIDWCSKKT